MDDMVKKVLLNAKRLVEKGHVKGVYAINSAGHRVPYYTPSATCFCALGALRRAHSDLGARPMALIHAECALVETVGSEAIADWNDHPLRTQAEVIEAFQKAAESVA